MDLILKEAHASSIMTIVEKSFVAGSPMDEAPLSSPNAIIHQSRAHNSPAIAVAG
jgi:hypothetical protein